MKINLFLATLVATLALTVTGCAKEEGTMEKAGKSLDEAGSKMSDAAKEASDDIKDAAKDE